MNRLLALTGVARCGKDDFAAPLIEAGYVRMAFGDVLKNFYAPLIRGEEGLYEVMERIKAANPLVQPEQLAAFYDEVLLPFWTLDVCCDPFTEDDRDKQAFRPILETGGDLIYQYALNTYLAQVDAALAAGQRIVNPRLVREPEARGWAERGGELVLIDCLHVEAVSAWEKRAMTDLKRSGYITKILPNWGTAEQWTAFARRCALEAS